MSDNDDDDDSYSVSEEEGSRSGGSSIEKTSSRPNSGIQSSHRRNSTSSTSSTLTTVSTSTGDGKQTKPVRGPLWTVPVDYFDIQSGLPPKSDEDARKKLWPVRKGRKVLKEGQRDDDAPPDAGKELRAKAIALRVSLEKHIEEKFWDDCKVAAKGCGLRTPDTGSEVKVKDDVYSALTALRNSQDMAALLQDKDTLLKAYLTVIHWHHARKWVKEKVKEWLKNNNMVVAAPTETEKKAKARNHSDSYGGFATCARNVKNAQVKKLNRAMMSAVGWSVAARRGRKDDETRDYKTIELTIPATEQKVDACLVTFKKDAKVSTLKCPAFCRRLPTCILTVLCIS